MPLISSDFSNYIYDVPHSRRQDPVADVAKVVIVMISRILDINNSFVSYHF